MLNNINEFEEFDDHRMVSYVYDNISGLEGYIAIHRGNSTHPAFGATRFWDYNSDSDAIKDALRLSKAMSLKAAMAGLGYGGAKGVLIKNGKNKSSNHKNLLRAYAEKVDYLGGHFITGTDVGISDADVKYMRRFSKYFVGTKTDPARFTALGVYYAIEICAKEVFGSHSLENLTISIQGVGKTGSELLKLIYNKAKRINIADINEKRLEIIRRRYPKIKVVSAERVHKIKTDVYCPCALGKCINNDNIGQLNCKIIVGSANNQLESESSGELLYKLGILYAPDYVVNAGGLISVVDEYENGNYRIRRTMSRVDSVRINLAKVINESKKKNKATNLVANDIASKLL